jgi:hypothetical protein
MGFMYNNVGTSKLKVKVKFLHPFLLTHLAMKTY